MRTALSIVLVATVAVGCSKQDETPKAGKPAAPDAGTKTLPPPPAAPDAAPPPPADALVEHDLSPQGAAWAGWTVTAPADGLLEVNDGTVKGGIAIRWGNGAGAMGFSQKKIDLKAQKRDFASSGDKVDRETADQLDVTITRVGTPLKCFYQNRKLAGTQVGCWTVSCVGDDADLARAHAICDSLAKQ